MKKLFFTLLMGLVLLPSETFAQYYESQEELPATPFPIKSPTINQINGWIDSNTGVFTICSNYDIASMHVTITQNGLLRDEFTQDLVAGTSTTYNFNGYAVGSYRLTIKDANGIIIAQYRITVLED